MQTLSLKKLSDIDMGKMNRTFWSCTLALLMIACGDNDEPNPEPVPTPSSEMTVISYFVANASNIEDDIWTNISAMYDGLSLMDKSATLLIYWDGSGSYGSWGYPVILRYTTDGHGNVNGREPLLEDATVEEVIGLAEVVKEYPSQLSTDKSVMSQVLKDLISLSPTDKVGLIAASHGSSWLNTIYMSRSARSFGQDGKGTDNTMIIKDMADAMKSTGKHFDFLLFDACCMGTIEVCYDLRDAVDYQIASVMEVPAYGFPYENSLHYLYEGNLDGYKKICQAYIDFYKEQSSNAWGTIALIDSKEMQSLTDVVKQEIIEHKDLLADYDVNVLQEYGRQGGPDIAYDLEQFIKNLNGNLNPENFKAQLDKTILYKGCLEKAKPSSYSVDADNFCGLGIYIPIPSRSKWNDYFKTIDWYTASGWNEVTFSWDF